MSRFARPVASDAINIIPLLDVLVVILFFFLVTMDFKQVKVLEITPPEVQSAEVSNKRSELLVSVSAEGLLAVNGKVVDKAHLRESLREQIGQKAYRELVILADGQTALEQVTFIVDLSRKLGITKIKLRSR